MLLLILCFEDSDADINMQFSQLSETFLFSIKVNLKQLHNYIPRAHRITSPTSRAIVSSSRATKVYHYPVSRIQCSQGSLKILHFVEFNLRA